MNVLFPVETINRELDFRLALGARFVKPGRAVYVGQHDALHHLVPSMRGGLYVGKNLLYRDRTRDPKRYRELKAAGTRVVYVHEEGAFFGGQEDEWRRTLDVLYDPSQLSTDPHDRYCTWGTFQAEYRREQRPDLADQVRVTGHPRFDLYKEPARALYAEQTAALRREVGPYVLVNTSKSYANHGLGLAHLFSAAGNYPVDDPGARTYHAERWAHGLEFTAALVPLVHRLSELYPGATVVLRPHPSEDHGFYRTVFAHLDNVAVRHDGPVGPWILGSEVLIHDGCSTAVEAYIAGKPVINFKPNPDPDHDVYVPNLVGLECRTPGEVVAAVGRALAGEHVEAAVEVPERAHDLFYNFRHDAFAAFLGVMEEVAATAAGPEGGASPAELRRRHNRRAAVVRSKEWVYRRLPSRRRDLAFYQTAFYGFDIEDVEAKLEALNGIYGTAAVCEPVSEFLFILRHAGDA